MWFASILYPLVVMGRILYKVIMRLLLVEDDVLLGSGVRAALVQMGFTVDWVQDGKAANAALDSGCYDLLVLDLGLPGCSGMEVLKRLRAAGRDLSVLILTARDEVADRVVGLDAGADDYLVKPFDLDELGARLRALQRRHSGRTITIIECGEFRLDPAAHQLTRAGETVDLSPREFVILHLLLANQGRIQSRARIEEALYAWGEEVESNAVEVHIHRLRRKLGNNLIRTVRGVGYVVEAP